ncbi:MAG TPA: ABC transporter permease [Vicinamibacterales bacterium]|nr:ABC transporter permease [Vicinamibacterales bacterium]
MRRLYRILLVLYPPAFRERFRAELLAAFDDERVARGAGMRNAVAFWVFILQDALATAGRQRARQFVSWLHRSNADLPHLPEPQKRSHMETVVQDVRYAVRQFAARPAFALVAVLSLAIGIGGNSVIYGLVDGYVLRPFPYPEADRLVSVGVTFPRLSSETTHVEALSPAEYMEIKGATSLRHVAAFDLGNRNISGGDVPERVFTGLLLDDLFPVIGMQPALGRGFTGEELAPGGARVAIISHRLWQSRFGGAHDIVNRTIRIGGEAATVVGVMPPGLILAGTDLWVPWGGDAARLPRNIRQFTLIARLAPGASLDQANAELTTIAGRIAGTHGGQFKEYEGWNLSVTPWASAIMQDARPAAFMLLGAVALVLLIACANLTNLLLARSTTRQRELAVRLALGAGRPRIARQLLTESLLLAIAGALAGLVLAYFALQSATALIPQQITMLGQQAGLNIRVLAWGIALALASGLLVALLPILQATRSDPQESLRSDARTGGSRLGRRVRHGLVVAEIALSVMLLLGAGLLMRSFWKLQHVDLGFQPSGVVTMRLTLPREKYPEDAAGAFFDRLAEEVRALPGVRAVAAASQFPPANRFSTRFALERDDASDVTLPTAAITVASPSYFETLGVALRRGRPFAQTDNLAAPTVVIVNQAFVARYLAGRDPIGERMTIGDPSDRRGPATIVGVSADYRNSGIARPARPEIFYPVRQQTLWNQLFLLLRGDSTAGLVAAVRRTVARLDPEQPIYAVQTMEEALAAASFQQKTATVLLVLFAGAALVLASIGIYGVMAYTVSARVQEMGVRLAMGAQRRDVIWMVVRQVLSLSVAGLIIGISGLLAAGKALSRLLYGVHPADPITVATVSALLCAVALVAAWGPAARASRVDPIEALRYE